MSLSNSWNKSKIGHIASEFMAVADEDAQYDWITGLSKALGDTKQFKGLDADKLRKGLKGVDLENIDDVTDAIMKLGTEGTGGITKLGNAFKQVGTGIKNFVLSPLGKVAIAIAAAVAAMALLDAVITTPAESIEKMDEAFSEFETAQSDLSSINSELETTRAKINQLEAKGGLTFVEKGELENLREATELLQIQQDLAEKEVDKKAKESAAATIAAYNKNFRHDISQENTDRYSGYIQDLIYTADDLVMDNSNISAMMAAVSQYAKLRDESEIGSTSWDEYNSKIENTTDAIWDQVSVLADYKSKLESVPESLRTDEQQQAIQDISDDIEYIYQTLDPAAWKQMKLDDLYSRDSLSKIKQDLVDLAKESNNTGISIEDIPQKLALAAKGAGIELQDLVDDINSEAGILDLNEVRSQIQESFRPDAANKGRGNWLKQYDDFSSWVNGLSDDDLKIVYDMVLNTDTANYTLQDWIDALELYKAEYSDFELDIGVEQAGISAVTTALSESVSATGLAAESISALESRYADLEGYNPSKLFENTAHGVHLNRAALNELEQQYDSVIKQDIASEMDRLSNQYNTLNDQIDEFKGTASEEILKDQRKDILDQIQALEQLAAQYNALTSDFAQWQNALSTENENAGYAAMGSQYESMKAILDAGWYGNDELNEYLDLMLSAENRTGDAVADFEKLNQTIEGTDNSLMDYWQYDGDTLVSDGLFDFLDDVNSKLGDAYAGVDENGEYFFDFSGDKLQEVADAFGMNTEAVEQFARAMIEAGMAVNMGQNSFDELLNTFQETGDVSGFTDAMSLDQLKAELESTKQKINELKAENIDVNGELDPTLEQQLDTLLAKLQQEYYLRLNTETGGALDEAVDAVEQIQEICTDPDTGKMTVTAEVGDGSEVANLVDQIAEMPEEVQTTIGVEAGNVGDAEAIMSQLQEAPESITVPVNYAPNGGEAAEGAEGSEATVTYTAEFADATPPELTGNVTYNATFAPASPPVLHGTVVYAASFAGAGGGVGVNGTAHVSGTALAGGNWGKAVGGKTLVGELGREIVVNPHTGTWQTVGDTGAEFVDIPKNAIVL